jgi:hypothetical protein
MAPATKEANRDANEDRDSSAAPHPWWRRQIDTSIAIALWLLLMGSLVSITLQQGKWISPLWGDLVRWASRPEIAGSGQFPAGAGGGVLTLFVFILIGWVSSTLFVATTKFEHLFGVRAALSLLLAMSVAGYVGVLAVIVGRLDSSFITAVTAVVVGVVGAAALMLPRSRAALLVRPRLKRPTALGATCLVVAVAIVTGISVHAALSPVTEWDALIYHAGAAKLWFLEAPHPALLYGSSVGIEISGNYPPLFPAIGALFDIASGSFQDVYLRLASPVILIATLLLVYGYAQLRVGSKGALLAVILAVGAPLIVLYGTWPTGYMLLTALWLGIVVVCDGAATSSHTSMGCRHSLWGHVLCCSRGARVAILWGPHSSFVALASWLRHGSLGTLFCLTIPCIHWHCLCFTPLGLRSRCGAPHRPRYGTTL